MTVDPVHAKVVSLDFSSALGDETEMRQTIDAVLMLNSPTVDEFDRNLFITLARRRGVLVVAADAAANDPRVRDAAHIVCGDFDSIAVNSRPTDLRVASVAAIESAVFGQLATDVTNGRTSPSAFPQRICVADQDSTDFGKCAALVERWWQHTGCAESRRPSVVTLGWRGGRFDHEMAALNVVASHASRLDLVLLDRWSAVFACAPCGTTVIHRNAFLPTCGLIPFGTLRCCATTGLQWNVNVGCAATDEAARVSADDLSDATRFPFAFDRMISTSNAFQDTVVTVMLEHPLNPPVLFTLARRAEP